MAKVLLTENSSEDLAYYNKIRDTIQGLDGIIVKVITDSVTMITGALTLSVVLYDKLDKLPWNSFVGLILVSITFLITLNSRGRIKLYSNLLGGAVGIAKAIEPKLFTENESLTIQLDRLPHAGVKGERLYLRSTIVLFIIEAALFSFYLLQFILSSTNFIKKLVQCW